MFSCIGSVLTIANISAALVVCGNVNNAMTTKINIYPVLGRYSIRATFVKCDVMKQECTVTARCANLT